MVLVTTVRNVLFALFGMFFVCAGSRSSLDSDLSEERNYLNPVSNGHTKYLTPEKCNRSERTRVICELLSKSQKFKTIEKYLSIKSRQTSITVHKSPLMTEKKKVLPTGFSQRFVGEDNAHSLGVEDSGKEFTNNFLDSGEYYSTEREDFPTGRIYKYPSLTQSKRDSNKFPHLRMPSLRQLRPFKMKKSRSMAWPKKVSNVKPRNKLPEVPLTVAGIPLIWTIGVALILKHYVKKPEAVEIPTKAIPPPNNVDAEKLKLDQKIIARDKFQLAKEVVSLTAESLNLAANKIDLLNVLARTLQPLNIGSFLTAQKFKVNGTLLNKVKTFRGSEGNMTNLIGEFVRVMAEQAVKNATDSIIMDG